MRSVLAKYIFISELILIIAVSFFSPSSKADFEREECADFLPDLYLHSLLIDNSTPLLQGQNVTILATIGNFGGIDASCVVRLYHLDSKSCSHLSEDEYYKNEQPIDEERLFIPANSTKVASLTWSAILGNHTLHVIISESIPIEKNILNNHEDIIINIHEYHASPGTNSGHFITRPSITPSTDDNTTLQKEYPISSNMLYPKLILMGSTLFLGLSLIPEIKKRLGLKGLGFIPIFYSRLRKEHVLENKLRAKIFEYILLNPGVDYSTLLKNLNTKNGVLSYHLSILEKEMFIRSGKDGVFRRYYPTHHANTLNTSSDIKKTTLGTILTTPGISQETITKVIKIDKCTASYILLSLEREGLIKRKTTRKGVAFYPMNT
jgi:DNA-binding MarR family transcriptional regulator